MAFIAVALAVACATASAIADDVIDDNFVILNDGSNQAFDLGDQITAIDFPGLFFDLSDFDGFDPLLLAANEAPLPAPAAPAAAPAPPAPKAEAKPAEAPVPLPPGDPRRRLPVINARPLAPADAAPEAEAQPADRGPAPAAPQGQIRVQLQVNGGPAVFLNAAPSAPVEKPADSDKPKLPPDAEKEMAELLAKLKEAKTKVWTERMSKEVEEVTKAAELSDAEQKALAAPAKEAVEAALVLWLDKMDNMFRKTIQRQPRILPQLINQYRQMADAYAENDVVPGVKQPQDNPAWVKGWQSALTAAHQEKWNKVLADRRTAAHDEMKDVLKPMEDKARDQFSSAIAVKAAEIKEALKLAPDRAAALDELGKIAVDQSMALWTERTEKTVTAMSDTRRKTMLQGRLFMGPDAGEVPELQPAWKDGVAKLLSADEVKRIGDMRAEHKARRVRMMAQLFLLYVDEKVALTTSQREKLTPLAEKLVQKQPMLFPAEGDDVGNFMSPRMFLAAGENAPEKEVRAIITDGQWANWKKNCVAQSSDDFGMPTEEIKDTPPVADTESIEQAVSNFMAGKAIKQRQRLGRTLLLQAEDAARVGGVAPEAYERLQTAARGATERSLQAWRVQFEQIVRGNMGEVTPATLKQRLAGLENYNSFQAPGDQPPQQALWKKSLETELSAEQRAAWQKEVDARKAFREKAIIETVLTEFDKQVPLRLEQWEKLEGMLTHITGEYSDEISNFFSFNEGSAWYLQSYTRFMPLAGLPEDDLKALLGKEQWDRWTKTDEYTNAKNYWNNIKQNHLNRRR